tara:strand:- start:1528 stop:1644 length:117 start_codon:yes stop_codon:yes gene_type:complete
MALFIIAVALYFYSWWSFEPQKEKNLVINNTNYCKNIL